MSILSAGTISAPAQRRHVQQDPGEERHRTGAVDALRDRWARWAEPLLLLGSDLVAVLATTALLPFGSPVPMLAAVLAWVLRGLYSRRAHLSTLDDVPALALGAGAAGVTALLLTHAQSLRAVAPAVLLLVLVVALRLVAYTVLRDLRARGRLCRTTVVVGSGERTNHLVRRILERPETGLRVWGGLGSVRADGAVRNRGRVRDLPAVVAEGDVDTVIVGDEAALSEAEMADVLRECNDRNIDLYVLPRLPELYQTTPGDDQVWGVPLHRVSHRWTRGRLFLKRALDVTVSLTALTLLSPLLLAVAVVVRVDLGRGVLFRQVRIGRHGREFELLKFRSMRPVAPGSAAAWVVDQSRLGRTGAFLRRFSLDELPQLFNVLRGDMSLVRTRHERL